MSQASKKKEKKHGGIQNGRRYEEISCIYQGLEKQDREIHGAVREQHGYTDKNDFSLILGEKPGFSQNNVAICRLIAWNVLLHRDAPELDKEVVDWANAMRVYTHVVDYPAVYRMDSIDDLRHLNAMAHLSMQYMRNESDRRQANCYKTYEDVEKYASNPKESLQYRRKTAE